MERIPKMKYNMELHTGDDNDNSIATFTMDADSKEKLFATLEKDFADNFAGNMDIVTIDGDENSITMLWSEYYDDKGNEVDPDDVDGTEDFGERIFHHDFYIIQD